MADRCPHLDYRHEGDGREFDVARAYCTVADRFVQPVRADVCNLRYDLDPAEHCEIYVAHHAEDGGGDAPTVAEIVDDDGDGSADASDDGGAGADSNADTDTDRGSDP